MELLSSFLILAQQIVGLEVLPDSGRPNLLILIGAPGMIRTCDPLIRSQVLYPAELRVPCEVKSEYTVRF